MLDVLEQGKQPPLGVGLAMVRGLAPNSSPAPVASEPEGELELEALRAARLKRLEACGGLKPVDQQLLSAAAA